MELCLSTYSLWRWMRQNHRTLEQALRWTADAGIGAVEFVAAGPDWDRAIDPIRRAATLRRRCETLGLRVAGLCVGAELLVPARRQRQAVEQLQRQVDLAVELGAPRMRHDVTTGPKSAKMLFAAVLDRVVDPIHRVADYAGRRGVATSLENHGFYLQTAARVQGVIEAVDHPNFSLTLDLGNFLCLNQDPVRATARLARFATMVHVKDFHVRRKPTMPPTGWFATPTPIALRGAIVGHGAIDVPAQLRLLRHGGYEGWLSLEFEGIEEPTQGIQMGMEFLRLQLNQPRKHGA